jgi:hypothetical protein
MSEQKKHRVRVFLVQRAEVEIDVMRADDEDPTDLDFRERDYACERGPSFSQWRVEKVREVPHAD